MRLCAERDEVRASLLEGVVDEAMEDEAPAADVELRSGFFCDVPDIGLPKAGDEAAFGLEGPVLAAEVGAEDVDVARALVTGDRLGVLCLTRGATGLGAQPLYLPASSSV